MTEKHRVRKPQDGFDTAWKGFLEPHLEAFSAMAMPFIHPHIDWKRGYEFCDGELRGAIRHGKKGRKSVDRLVKVWLLSGQQQYLYIHIEIQTQRDAGFARRMWVYFTMLDAKLKGEVISMAVLADDDPDWRPNQYEFSRWGNSGIFRFPVFKLMDYAERCDELMASGNIFGIVIAAHLKALATRRRMRSRKEWKSAILKELMEQGRSQAEFDDVFRFLDLVMALPGALQEEFDKDVQKMEEEKGMPFLSYIEQDAMKRGRQEGRQEGRHEGRQEGRQEGEQNAVLQALNVRFDQVSSDIQSAVRSITDIARLIALHRQAILCKSIDEFQSSLQ